METQTSENLTPVSFELPKRKRKVMQKDAAPVKRSFCVIPWRAVIDKRMTPHQFKTLAAIVSYCNKAGITWVGLERVGKDLGVTKQAVSKHYRILINLGYIRIINKGFKGIRGNTIQVIFDDSLTVEDTIAKASIGTDEDLRAPYIRERQEREAMREQEIITEQQARENQKRLAEMIKTAFKTPSEANKQIYKPVKGDTMTVRKMKESIQKARVKPVDNPVDKSVDKSVDNLLKDGYIDNHRELSEERKDICRDIVYKDNNVNNMNDKVINDKVITVNNISFDKVLTLVLTYDDARARLSEDDIGMLERLANAGVTESELMQALADHGDKSTAAMCREVLLSR
jgi:predicted ArsR family transcriptional regulator